MVDRCILSEHINQSGERNLCTVPAKVTEQSKMIVGDASKPGHGIPLFLQPIGQQGR